MDKISQLLAEARPLYLRKRKQKRAVCGMVLSLCLCLGIWNALPKPYVFDSDGFDSYFTALYLNDGNDDGGDDNSLIPVNRYGLYEV